MVLQVNGVDVRAVVPFAAFLPVISDIVAAIGPSSISHVCAATAIVGGSRQAFPIYSHKIAKATAIEPLRIAGSYKVGLVGDRLVGACDDYQRCRFIDDAGYQGHINENVIWLPGIHTLAIFRKPFERKKENLARRKLKDRPTRGVPKVAA